MKMKIKIPALFLAALLAFSAFAGCNNSVTPAPDKEEQESVSESAPEKDPFFEFLSYPDMGRCYVYFDIEKGRTPSYSDEEPLPAISYGSLDEYCRKIKTGDFSAEDLEALAVYYACGYGYTGGAISTSPVYPFLRRNQYPVISPAYLAKKRPIIPEGYEQTTVRSSGFLGNIGIAFKSKTNEALFGSCYLTPIWLTEYNACDADKYSSWVKIGEKDLVEELPDRTINTAPTTASSDYEYATVIFKDASGLIMRIEKGIKTERLEVNVYQKTGDVWVTYTFSDELDQLLYDQMKTVDPRMFGMADVDDDDVTLAK